MHRSYDFYSSNKYFKPIIFPLSFKWTFRSIILNFRYIFFTTLLIVKKINSFNKFVLLMCITNRKIVIVYYYYIIRIECFDEKTICCRARKKIKYLFGGGKKYLIKIHKYNFMMFWRSVWIQSLIYADCQHRPMPLVFGWVITRVHSGLCRNPLRFATHIKCSS